MSSPASATEPGQQARLCELIAAGSLEISPRELHQAAAVAALLPAGTCAYIPSLPGLPLARMLEIVAAMRKAGLDPVPHVAARRIRARVVRSDPLSPGTCRCAVEFVEVTPDQQAEIDGLVQFLRTRPPSS